MGNQANAKAGVTVFSTSTRNFPNRLGKTLFEGTGQDTDVVRGREQALAQARRDDRWPFGQPFPVLAARAAAQTRLPPKTRRLSRAAARLVQSRVWDRSPSFSHLQLPSELNAT